MHVNDAQLRALSYFDVQARELYEPFAEEYPDTILLRLCRPALPLLARALRRWFTTMTVTSIPRTKPEYCALVPYCGADPIEHYARQADPIGHRVYWHHQN